MNWPKQKTTYYFKCVKETILSKITSSSKVRLQSDQTNSKLTLTSRQVITPSYTKVNIKMTILKIHPLRTYIIYMNGYIIHSSL